MYIGNFYPIKASILHLLIPKYCTKSILHFSSAPPTDACPLSTYFQEMSASSNDLWIWHFCKVIPLIECWSVDDRFFHTVLEDISQSRSSSAIMWSIIKLFIVWNKAQKKKKNWRTFRMEEYHFSARRAFVVKVLCLSFGSLKLRYLHFFQHDGLKTSKPSHNSDAWMQGFAAETVLALALLGKWIWKFWIQISLQVFYVCETVERFPEIHFVNLCLNIQGM